MATDRPGGDLGETRPEVQVQTDLGSLPPRAPLVRGAIDAAHARRARIGIALLAGIVAWASLPYLPGLMGAVVLGALVGAPYRWLAPRLGAHRAAFLLAVASAVLLVAPIALVVVTALREAPAVLQRALASPALARLAELRLGPLDVGEQLAAAGRSILGWGSAHAVAAAGSVTRGVINLLLAVVGVYYLLPSRAALWRRISAFVPFSPRATDHLAERFSSITEAAVLGILAAGVSQGLTIGVAFWLVGLPNPVFWAAVTALVSILPVLGSAIVWIPGVVTLLLAARPAAALVLALVGVVISSNVDNVVRPVVYRRVSGLHPMASLLGAFAGMELFGLVGLVLGPLGIAWCIELLRLYESEYGAPE
jgi:predicted PurR-regulated permease PerM